MSLSMTGRPNLFLLRRITLLLITRAKSILRRAQDKNLVVFVDQCFSELTRKDENHLDRLVNKFEDHFERKDLPNTTNSTIISATIDYLRTLT